MPAEGVCDGFLVGGVDFEGLGYAGLGYLDGFCVVGGEGAIFEGGGEELDD